MEAPYRGAKGAFGARSRRVVEVLTQGRPRWTNSPNRERSQEYRGYKGPWPTAASALGVDRPGGGIYPEALAVRVGSHCGIAGQPRGIR